VDPRTISPQDTSTLLGSVRNTGRLVAVDECNPVCSFASELVSLAACEAYGALRSAPVKVTAPHTPVPAAPDLEQYYVPSLAKIEEAIRSTVGASGSTVRKVG
ncbi:MAG: transketolase C-terminal domain-containing protein, partial [Steroidobacteraceae bacterium]